MSDITVDFAQYTTDTTLNGPYDAGDNVTLADDSSVLDNLTTAQIDGLSTNNVDFIDATDGVLSWDEAQFAHLADGTVAIDPDTFALLADTGANIALLTPTEIAALAEKGLAAINPTDSTLDFTVAQFEALGAISVDASTDFTLADSGANLAAMSAGEISSLGLLGVDHLDATDDVLALSVAQYQALGSVTLTAGDDVTLADTSTNLETLSATDIGNLAGNGIDHIDATDDVLTIDLAQFDALGSVTLTPSDIVTLADTGAAISALTTGDIDTLGAGGIDIFDATDNAISFTVAQYNETVIQDIALTAADTVTLADTGANLAALTATDIGNLVNVDAFDATDDTLTLSVDQFNAVEGASIALAAGDTVTLSDTAANLATLDFSTLAAANVDQLDATTAYTTLTVAQLTALGAVVFTGASAVTLTDTGADIAAVSDFSTFAAHGVDVLDASDDTLTISEAQFQALGTTTLTGADTVTISDTAANIVVGPNYGTLAAAGVDFLDATTAISVTVNDITNLGAVVFTAASAVTLSDTGAHIAAVANFTTFGTHGVDTIDASNNTLTINATQFGELGSVALTAADTVTISDSAAHLNGLTFSTLAGKNVDFLNSTNAYTTLTVQNVTDLGAVHFTAASSVTLTDTAADIQAVSDFTTFATHGVDTIKSSDNTLSLTVAQFSGLGTTHLTGADAITLADTAANLNTYLDTAGTQTALSANGVDTIHATGGSISVDAAAFTAVHGAGAVFLAGDSVTLADTSANIEALDFTALNGSGVDVIDATDDTLTITIDQYNELYVAGVVLTAADDVTLAAAASDFENITAVNIATLDDNLIDHLVVTSGGDLDWSVAQWQALPATVSVSDAGGSLVVSDSEANIEALTGTDLGALATSGAQVLDPTEGTLNLSVSQAEGFLGTGLAIASGDTGTLADTGANIAGMSATQIGELAAAGFDSIDASDDMLTLSVAQLSALGTVHDAHGDALTLADTASNLVTYLDGGTASTALLANGVDTIHATGGTLTIDAAAFLNVAGTGAVFAAADSVTISDTAANLGALSYSSLAGYNIDFLDATSAIDVTVQNLTDLGSVHFTGASNVTLADTGANISAVADFSTFNTHGVDTIDATDDAFTISVTQFNALTTNVHLTAADVVTIADTQTTLQALSGATLTGMFGRGIDVIHSLSGSLTVTTSQLSAFYSDAHGGGDAHFLASDVVTWASTGSDIALNVPSVLQTALSTGVDYIDATDDVINFDDGGENDGAAQYLAILAAGTHLTAADDVSITDSDTDINTMLHVTGMHANLITDDVNTLITVGGTGNYDAQSVAVLEGTPTVFQASDSIALYDTGANIAALTATQLGGLQAIGVDTIDASDDTLSISLSQYEDIAGVVALTAGDDVTVTGNLDNLSTTEIAGFGTNHVDHLLDTDGFNEVIWNVAQWNALATNLTIDNSAHIAGQNFVFDSAANLSAVTATQVAHFVAEGAQTWEESPAGDDTLVTWTVANTQAMGGSAFSDGTHVTVVDTASNIEGVSDFSIFAAHGIDSIDSTDDTLTITAAQFGGLGTTTLTGADAVTIADTAANIDSFLDGASAGTELSTDGVDTLHATGGTLSVTAAELNQVLGSGAVFESTDTVTISDTGAHIAALDFSGLAGVNVDSIDASDDMLTITLDQYDDIAGVVTLTAGDDVSVTASASDLEALLTSDISAFETNLVDHLVVASGGDLDWSIAQWQALPGDVSIALGAGNSTAELVVFDSQAHIQGLTHADLAALAAQGATELASSNGVMNLTVNQVTGFLGTALSAASGDTVTISDTGAHIDALTAAQIGQLAGAGVDSLFANDGSITFDAAQFDALGTVHVAAGNTFTVSDTETNLEALGTDGYTAMAAAGVDVVDSTTGSLTVTWDEFSAILGSGLSFTAGNTVTLTGSQSDTFGGTHDGTFFAGLGGYNIDTISITGGTATLDIDQWNGLQTAAIAIDSANDVTLDDAAAFLSDETTGDIAAMSGQIDHWEVSDGQTALLTKAQLDALASADINFTPTSAVILFYDAETTIEGLTATQLEGYITEGVNAFSASDTSALNLSAAQVTAVIDNGAYFAPADTVALADTATAIGALTATQWGELVTGFVDAVTATGGTLQMSIADFEAVKTALHSGALTLTNAAQLTDTGANIIALTTTEIGQLASDNITTVSATGDVTWSEAQFAAASGLSVTSTGTVTLADTEANIESLTTSQIDNYAGIGANHFHSTDVANVLHFTAAQADHIISNDIVVANTTVTVSDTGADISGLSASDIGSLASAGFTAIVVSSGDISWTSAQLSDNTLEVITASGGHFILADSATNIQADTASDFTNYIAQGVDEITTTSGGSTLDFTAAEAVAFEGYVVLTQDGGVVSDTSTNIDALTVTQIQNLASTGFSAIDATDDAVSFSVAQYNALGAVAFTAGDTVTLADTGANLATLDFGALAGANVDTLDATDNTLTITAAQFSALGTVTLTAGDTVTVSDAVSNIGALNFATLAGKNVDILDITSGPFSLSVARYLSLGTVAFSAASTVTLFDTGANLASLTAVQIGQLGAHGIDAINANDNVLTLTVAQYGALGTVALTGNDTVTLADTGANLQTLDFSQLAAKGVDVLDATDNVLSISVSQYNSLGAVHLTAGDTVTLADIGANIAALTATQFGQLAGNGIDKIDATNNVLSLSVAQFSALGTVTLTGSDTITLLDTGANLETLNFSTLASKGVDILDASDNVLTLTAAQFNSLGTVSLKSSDTVTLTDTGAHISALTVGQFNALAAKGIDIVDATDDAYTLTVAKVEGISPSLSLAANDIITLQDTEANIEGMSAAQITAAIARGIDIIHANSGHMSMTAAQVAAVLGTGAVFFASDTVTLADTGANIAALSAAQIGELAAAGVDKIDASDDTLNLTVAQYQALGAVTLAAADTVTLHDDNGALTNLAASVIQGLSANGIDQLQSLAGEHNFTFSYAQTEALLHQTGGGHLGVAATDTFYVDDTGANIGSLTAAEITALGALGAAGVDLIASGAVSFSVAQYNAAVTASVTIDSSDNATLADTGANIAALTAGQIGNLAANGIDHIDSTNDVLTITVAQFQALGVVTLAAGDLVTVSDSEANIEALDNTGFSALVSNNVDVIHATGGTLNVSVSQVTPLLGSSTAFDSANTVTLVDTGADVAALSATQIGELAAAGVDAIDTSDNMLTLTVGQFHALGSVALSAGDTNTLSDGFLAFFSMSTADIANLDDQHVSHLHSTDGVKGFQWSVAQWSALGSGITADSALGTVTVFDTAANDQSLTVTQIGNFHAAGVNTILDSQNASVLQFTVAQTAAILADGIVVASYPSPATLIGYVVDTGANLATLTTGQIGMLHAAGFTAVDASDDAVTFSKAQVDAFNSGSIALTAGDTVTMNNSEAGYEGFTAANFTAYITQGVDVFHSNSGILALNESQVAAVIDGGASFDGPNAVTLADTAANIGLLTATEYGELASHGVDIIDITSGTLQLSVADYTALGAFTVVGGTATLVDTGADIATLSSTQLGALTGTGITHIDATGNALSLTAAQATAILHQTGAGTVSFDGTDAVTVADTGANIAGISAADFTALGGDGAASVKLDASDDALTITTAQYNAIIGASISLTAGDYVTLADTGANLAALTAGQLTALAANNVDAIHATDNAVTFSISQLNALSTAGVALTQADTVTMSDTAGNIQALTSTQLSGYATQGVDIVSATGGTLSMSKAQVGAVVGSTESFATANTVTLLDTGANIAALSPAQFGLLAAHGVDIIDASDNVLSLVVSDYTALGSTQLTASDTVTLADTGGHISALSAAQFGQLAANGIDVIDATNNSMNLTVAQYQALGATTLTMTDTDVLKDTGATLGALTVGQIGALAAGGIDRIDASDNVLTISMAQYNALGTVVLTGGDTVTLADTGAVIGALSASQITALSAAGIDKFDATDNALSLSVAQYNALHHITLTPADTVTLSDTGADIAALTATKIGALAAAGIDVIDASDNAITFSLAQYNALGTVQLATNDVVTVNGTGATDLIDGRNGSQILNGQGGDDVLFGEAGNDTLDGGLGNDTLNGGTGNDTALYSDATSSVTVNLASGTAVGGAGTDLLTSIENVTGSNFNDVLTGDSGNNTLIGGAGNDVLTGGLGSDTLYGGLGADHFVFTSIADSAGGAADKIMDFSHADGDVIDLSAIDAITGGSDDAFTLVSGGFTHHAGQLIVLNVGTDTYSVRGDVNGDGVADFFITVHSSTALVASDFIL
ncbi:MAG TPA: hypothetical protein VMH86_15310 [Rhizomicrobium sp.]|nr:hypothetical protein [Rhizomicrobium sp.]